MVSTLPAMSRAMEITGARIWTGDPHRPTAHVLRIQRGRIVAIDSPVASSDADVIDASGRTLIPGLIDAHLHLLMGGRALSQLDLSRVRSRDDFSRAIAERHEALPPGQWLIAIGWSNENWGGEDPAKSWLAAAGERPVVCYRMDLHAALVNEAVLRRCDLSREPTGGRIVRDRRGEPTGLMVEAAAWTLINPLVPGETIEQKQAQIRAAQAHAHARGLTAVGSMEYSDDLKQAFAPLRDQLSLRIAVTLLDRNWPLDVGALQRRFRMLDDHPHLRVIGCKAFIDGTLGSRTARLLDNYVDDPGNRGMLVELAAEGNLNAWAERVASCGWSPSMHAIGDAAVRMALDAADAAERVNRGRRAKPRIEHAELIAPADVPCFGQRIASMQPLHKADDGRYAAHRLGEDRMDRFFLFRSLEQAGAILAFGSDWPVVDCDPLAGMRSAITGLTFDGGACRPEQNLSVESALRAYTTGAARALQLDDAGSLRIGAWGDCVLLDRDPFSADWKTQPPRVLMTIVGGEVVYDAREPPHDEETHASR